MQSLRDAFDIMDRPKYVTAMRTRNELCLFAQEGLQVLAGQDGIYIPVSSCGILPFPPLDLQLQS